MDPSVVMARDQTNEVHDPFQGRGHHPDDTVCSGCGAVMRDQHWVIDPDRAELLLSAGTPHQVLCPACQQAAERLPEGILTLRGDYWPQHRDEILHLIRNQAAEGQPDNPLERILNLREEGNCLIVETTNAKLAQKIGRSLKKAHQGHLKYQWGDENRLARVNWERNAG
jgi:hypothetical protein